MPCPKPRPNRVARPGARVLGHPMTSIQDNRRHWNLNSRAYKDEHNPQIGAAPRLWGMFAIPDAQLRALRDVTGKRVLELGCGAGQWSRALAAEGAVVVGFDLSEAQLAAAAQAMGSTPYPLVQGAAEQLPFAAASFDVVFCDHGGVRPEPPPPPVSRTRRAPPAPPPPGFYPPHPAVPPRLRDEPPHETTPLPPPPLWSSRP